MVSQQCPWCVSPACCALAKTNNEFPMESVLGARSGLVMPDSDGSTPCMPMLGMQSWGEVVRSGASEALSPLRPAMFGCLAREPLLSTQVAPDLSRPLKCVHLTLEPR